MKKICLMLLCVCLLLPLAACDLSALGELGEIAEGALGGLEQWKEYLPENDTEENLRDRKDDFMNLGLGEKAEDTLILLAEKGTGTITMGDHKYILCENGDMVIDDGTKLEVFTLADYSHYSIGEDHYGQILYGAAYKKEYYTGVYSNSTLPILMEIDHGATVSDGLSYVTSRGRTLLSPGVSPTEDCVARGISQPSPADMEGLCELWNYTEYSGKVNPDYLTTKYMHPQTRDFAWLHPYADKVKSWNILYIEGIAMETSVHITFTENFTTEDCTAVKNILKGYGMSGSGMDDLENALTQVTPDQLAAADPTLDPALIEKLLGALGEGGQFSGLGTFEGRLPVYQMPFKHEGDNWYDDYKMMGFEGTDSPLGGFQMSVSYLHKYWYDGGSFATYVRRKEGLYRTTGDSGMWVIDAQGNRIEYDYETGIKK